MSRVRVLLAGNPNAGKTTLFNRLTGSTARVGNYPGVTVECSAGALRLDGEHSVELMDLPGTYSLSARSPEERVAVDALFARGEAQPAAVVVVVDATALTRNLYLALQLLETGVPVVVALNMMDAARKTGLAIDHEALSQALGAPVVPISAARGEGLDVLRGQIATCLGNPGERSAPSVAMLISVSIPNGVPVRTPAIARRAIGSRPISESFGFSTALILRRPTRSWFSSPLTPSIAS